VDEIRINERKKKIKNMIKNNSLVIIDTAKIEVSKVTTSIIDTPKIEVSKITAPELKVYNNASTEKKAILSDNKGKAPAEEPQALREGPGRPFPELVYTSGNIMNLIKSI
jgi:hypothetical protein